MATSASTSLELHLDQAIGAVQLLRQLLPDVQRRAEELAAVLLAGGRLLAAGNGGSAALAQHLTSELVGRFEAERRPFSALCLSAETSSLTALGNDYGFETCFQRQVLAHGRPGDVLVLISTSGRSQNLLIAGHAARASGVSVWAMTGGEPNPLAALADETLSVEAPTAAAVQEAQQVLVHLLCRAFDVSIRAADGCPA